MSDREYRLAAIMFTDISGFSQMMERDESGTLDILGAYHTQVSESVEAHGGRLIKKAGDAVMCEFPNTANAVKCAVEIQNHVASHNSDGALPPYGVRIGIHMGEIYFVQDDALGEGVAIADHLQRIARPGRICISQDVQNLISSKLTLNTRSVGPLKAAKVTRKIEAFEISVAAAAEHGASPDEPDEADQATQRATSDRMTTGPDGAATTDRVDSGDSDFDSIKAFVLQEIKRVGRRIPISDIRRRFSNRSERLDRVLESLADKGFLTRDESATTSFPRPDVVPVPVQPHHGPRSHRGAGSWGDGDWGRHEWSEKSDDAIHDSWDRALATPPPVAGYDSLVEDYKDHVADAAEKEKAGFRGHLITYLAVNAGLFFLWSSTMFGGFPWFAIVLAGWGIGMVSHFQAVRDKVRESRDLERFQAPTREQLRIYRKLVKARNAFSGHLVSNAATAVFLAFLNLIVSPGFFWAIFPIGFMAIGVLSHLPAFKAKERRLLKRLRAAGANISHLLRGRKAPAGEPAVPTGGPASQEAERVRGRIAAAIAQLPEGSPVGDELTPILDSYVDQIKLLDRKNSELDVIMHDIPVNELDRDLAVLRDKRNRAEDRKMITEYENQIQQIEKQQNSNTQLKNQREMMRIRLNTGLNQLRQMEIDLARMRTLSADTETGSFSMLREKSDELGQYLEDLEAGFRELE